MMFLSSSAHWGGKKVNAIVYGVGAMGSEVARYALAKEWLQIVGAIDYDRSKVGKDLGRIIGLGRNIGIRISDDPAQLFRQAQADIVILTTGSFFAAIYDQLEMAARAGLRVVTTAEELAFPSLQNPELAKRLDDLARQKGVAIMAVGVNPGFVMDSLVVYLAATCLEVQRVRVKRVVNSSLRRKQLQLKVGAGLTPQAFKDGLGKSFFGHVGLLESAALVADGVGIRPDKISQSIEPVIASRAASTEYVKVKAGDVAGMRQVARCFKGDRECVALEVQFYLDAPDPRDEIRIDGTPNIDVTIKDGIFGDQATVAILVHSIPRLLDAKPGLVVPTGKSVADTFWECSLERGY